MSYGNYCFYMLVLTSLTGSICYLLWLLARILFKRYKFIWNERFFYILQAAFVLPVLFIGLLIYHRDGTLFVGVTNRISNALFNDTQVTQTVVRNFFILWEIGVAVYMIRQISSMIFIHRLLVSSVPADDPRITELFAEVKDTLDIRQEICLLQNDMLVTPIMTGVFRKYVILPFHTDKKQMRMILMHELLHIKHHHMRMKLLMIPVQILNVLNPIAHIFRKILYLELEKLCDRRIYDYLDTDRKNTIADYYQMMLNSLNGGVLKKRVETIGFPLFRTESDLQRRIKDMHEFRKAKAVKRGMAVLLTFCLLFGSSLTVFAAGEGVVQIHQSVYDATKVLNEESAAVNTLEEHEFTAEMWNEFTVTVMSGDDAEAASTVKNINWSVSAHGGTKSGLFYLHEGDKVGVMVSVNPDNLTVRVGLDYPNGNGVYVSGSGIISHTFIAPMDGYYDFFVSNSNSVSVTATGSYGY